MITGSLYGSIDGKKWATCAVVKSNSTAQRTKQDGTQTAQGQSGLKVVQQALMQGYMA